MSVRATQSLIADVVVASGLPKSPLMVVASVNEEQKTVTTVWFSDDNAFQQGNFPSGALDRAEEKKAQQKPAQAKGKTGPGKKK